MPRGLPLRRDRDLVVALPEILLDEEVPPDAVRGRAREGGDGAGAEPALGGEEPGRLQAVERRRVGAQEEGRVGPALEVEELRALVGEQRELGRLRARGVGQRRQRRRGLEAERLERERVVDGRRARGADLEPVEARLDGRRRERRAAVDRDRERRAVLGLGVERPLLLHPEADGHGLARALRDRERLAQVERQRAEDKPRAHLRLPVQVDGVDVIAADLELGELRRRTPDAPARPGARERIALSGGVHGQVDDALLHRLGRQHVVAGVQVPDGAGTAHVRRRVVGRERGEERLDAEARLDTAREHLVLARPVDAQEGVRGLEEVRAADPGLARGKGDHLRPEGPLVRLLRVRPAPAGDDRGRIDRVGRVAGVDRRDPVLPLAPDHPVATAAHGRGAQAEVLEHVGLARRRRHRHHALRAARAQVQLGDRHERVLADGRRAAGRLERVAHVRADAQRGGPRLGQLQAEVGGIARHEPAVGAERAHGEAPAADRRQARDAEAEVQGVLGALLGLRLRDAAVGRQ